MTIKPDDLNIFYVVHRTVYYKSYKHTFLAIFKTAYWFDCIYLKNLSLSNFVYNLILSGPVYLSIQTDFKTVDTDQRKMAMADTLFFNGRQDKYPYHTNYPPTVPRYPSSQEMFRRESPDKYTKVVGMIAHQELDTKIGQRSSHQSWYDKWYDSGVPKLRREELPKLVDRHEPCNQPWQYNVGTSAIPRWTKEGKDWPISKAYLNQGRPPTETTRARGINRLSIPKEENLYPFSNYMTSQYRKPVYSIFGHLQRDKVYGVTHQHNRHGNMPFEDHY